MKAILIDVEKKIVSTVDYTGYSDIDKYLKLDGRPFTVIGMENNDAVYIDDEGLLIDNPIGAFVIDGYPQPLSGNGLILGTDDEGETVACESTVEAITKRVRFVPVELLKGIPTAPQFIPMNDKEFENYFRTGELPLGKRPINPQ